MSPGLQAWKPDGVIAHVASPVLARQLHRLRVPVVNLYEQHNVPGQLRVLVDHGEVVRLAVEHMRERGLQHLAYVGFPIANFSVERRRFFEKHLASPGIQGHVYVAPSSGRVTRLASMEAMETRHAVALADWLNRLPKPVGVLCCNDVRAQQVLSVCADQGIAVPDAVAVIGVDNDEVRCELARPTLSSVDPNAFRVGYEAAAILHRAIRNHRLPRREIVVQPVGVVQRRSTDVLVFTNSAVAELVRTIREQACHGLTLKELVRQSGVSRSTLDRWFLNCLGRTPRSEINRLQIERVRDLLATTDLPLKQISRLAGFSRRETMHKAFQRATRQTPAEYRRSWSERGAGTAFQEDNRVTRRRDA
jgi:LacI family transcriptional regulator